MQSQNDKYNPELVHPHLPECKQPQTAQQCAPPSTQDQAQQFAHGRRIDITSACWQPDTVAGHRLASMSPPQATGNGLLVGSTPESWASLCRLPAESWASTWSWPCKKATWPSIARTDPCTVVMVFCFFVRTSLSKYKKCDVHAVLRTDGRLAVQDVPSLFAEIHEIPPCEAYPKCRSLQRFQCSLRASGTSAAAKTLVRSTSTFKSAHDRSWKCIRSIL